MVERASGHADGDVVWTAVSGQLHPELVEGASTSSTRIPPGPLRLGSVAVPTPVVLAPMAGITNAAYRQLCREQGAGLYVCEMITSRGLVERDAKTLAMLQFDPGERVRSVQLYGVDPQTMAEATRILITEHGVGHVDLNFGCPVPKVTRKGGGAALPYKRDRLAMILTSAVRAAEPYGVPVTIKTRIGIDADHQTFLDAGRIAEEAGCAAIALHGRTAQQAYSGEADWTAIAALKSAVSIPVLGNGDIWEAADALRMVAETRVDGVVIGRGCSVTWPRLSLVQFRGGQRGSSPPRGRAGRIGRCPTSARWRLPYAGTPSCWSGCPTRPAAAPTCANTWPGTSRASRWAASCAAGWP